MNYSRSQKMKPSFGEMIYHKFSRRTKSENIVFTVYFILFILFAAFSIFPLFYCFMNSMKTLDELYGSDPLSFPSQFKLDQFTQAIKEFEVDGVGFWEMLWNSCWQCFGSSALNILASLLVAYPLARYKFPGNKIIYFIIIFRITIPIIGTAPAQYRLFKTFDMLDNPSLFWMAWLSGFDMSALIFYSYLKNIDKSYSEAAYLDGANRLQVMFRVILPQILPCIIALYTTQVLATWNNYQTPMLYMRSYPNLAYGLYKFESIVSNSADMSMSTYYASVCLAAIPPMILYAIGQRKMLENVSAGGIKG